MSTESCSKKRSKARRKSRKVGGKGWGGQDG